MIKKWLFLGTGSAFNRIISAVLASILLAGSCYAQGFSADAGSPVTPAKQPQQTAPALAEVPQYLIGPGDTLNVFVWRNAELTTTIPVRPDGRISIPLVEDLIAAGKTPTQLAREIEAALSRFVREPSVTVIITSFAGSYRQLVRVIGEATQPQALPYRERMTLLDVLIAVGGLTEYAAGNRATIVRDQQGVQRKIRVRIHDLIKDGDIEANVEMLPGDILIIPEAWF